LPGAESRAPAGNASSLWKLRKLSILEKQVERSLRRWRATRQIAETRLA
jgi:hypothetical protein